MSIQRMLIVEDERDLCELLADFFTSHGFTVSSAFSGEEALARLEDQPADVILLDILLPGLSGLEVLRRAKRLYPRAKVVMVTGVNQGEVRDEARRWGAAAYITKPFDFSPTTWSTVLSGIV